MNDDELRQALRDAAGTATPTDRSWDAIVEEAERRRHAPSAGLRRFRVAVAAAAVVGLGAVGLAAVQSPEPEAQGVRAGVPSVTGGSSDLIVESGTLNDQGGHLDVPESVAAEVSTVEGVDVVVGVVRAFARFAREGGNLHTPSVVVSWDGGDGFAVERGQAPAGPGEVALTPLAAERLGVDVGGALVTDTGTRLVVTGTFVLPDDAPDVALAAVDLDQARRMAGHGGFTRLHVQLDEDADAQAVADAIVDLTPAGYRVVGVNQLGTTQQLRDELEVQQAYFDIMNPDPAIRVAAIEGAVDDETSRANYERLRDQAALGTLRIQRFVFLDTDHAEVVYAIWYGSNRSPMVPEPQRGRAVRVDGRWKLSRTTVCGLANLVNEACDLGDSAPPPPPAGWQDPDSQPEAVDAFRTMADPRSSLQERIDVVVGGRELRALIRAGLEHDQAYAGAVAFHVSGVRRDGDAVEVLYAVRAEGELPIETPYPLIGRAVRDGGRWRLDPTVACGLLGLVNRACPEVADTTTTTTSTSTTTEPPPEATTTTSTEAPATTSTTIGG